MGALRLAAALVAAFVAAPLGAQVPGEKTVDGIVVRIGIASAGQVAKHAAAHGEDRMHGGPRRGENDHVVVSLADGTSGERIAHAGVSVEVHRAGVAQRRRDLEFMPGPGVPSYGGWFDLGGAGPYRLKVEVALPGSRRKSTVEFDLDNRSPRTSQ